MVVERSCNKLPWMLSAFRAMETAEPRTLTSREGASPQRVFVAQERKLHMKGKCIYYPRYHGSNVW